MKNYKRAQRRADKKNHVIRRTKIWYKHLGYHYTCYADFLNDVLKGEKCLWIRSVNVPCSCHMCSKEFKYKRHIQKRKDNNIINNELIRKL